MSAKNRSSNTRQGSAGRSPRSPTSGSPSAHQLVQPSVPALTAKCQSLEQQLTAERQQTASLSLEERSVNRLREISSEEELGAEEAACLGEVEVPSVRRPPRGTTGPAPQPDAAPAPIAERKRGTSAEDELQAVMRERDALLAEKQQWLECEAGRQGQWDKLVSERDGLAAECTQQQEQQSMLMDLLMEAQDKTEALEQQLAEAGLATGQVQGTVATLRANLEASEGRYEALCNAVRALSMEAVAVREQLVGAMAVQEPLTAEISRGPESPRSALQTAKRVPCAHPELEMHAAVLTDLRGLLPCLSASLEGPRGNGTAEHDREVRALQQKLWDAKQRQDEGVAEVQRLQAVVEDRERRVASLEAASGGSTGDNPELLALVQRLGHSAQALEAAEVCADELQGRVDVVVEALTAGNTLLEAEMRRLRDVVKSATVRTEGLELQLHNAEGAGDRLHCLENQIRQRLNDLAQQNHRLTSAMTQGPDTGTPGTCGSGTAPDSGTPCDSQDPAAGRCSPAPAMGSALNDRRRSASSGKKPVSSSKAAAKRPAALSKPGGGGGGGKPSAAKAPGASAVVRRSGSVSRRDSPAPAPVPPLPVPGNGPLHLMFDVQLRCLGQAVEQCTALLADREQQRQYWEQKYMGAAGDKERPDDVPDVARGTLEDYLRDALGTIAAEIDAALGRHDAVLEDLLHMHCQPPGRRRAPGADRVATGVRDAGASVAAQAQDMAARLSWLKALAPRVSCWREAEDALRAAFLERDQAVQELEGRLAASKELLRAESMECEQLSRMLDEHGLDREADMAWKVQRLQQMNEAMEEALMRRNRQLNDMFGTWVEAHLPTEMSPGKTRPGGGLDAELERLAYNILLIEGGLSVTCSLHKLLMDKDSALRKMQRGGLVAEEEYERLYVTMEEEAAGLLLQEHSRCEPGRTRLRRWPPAVTTDLRVVERDEERRQWMIDGDTMEVLDAALGRDARRKTAFIGVEIAERVLVDVNGDGHLDTLVVPEGLQYPGVKVLVVSGPAQRDGIRMHDVVTHVDGHPTNSLEQFRRAASAVTPGATTVFTVTRNHQTKTIDIRTDEVEHAAFVPGARQIHRIALRSITSSDPDPDGPRSSREVAGVDVQRVVSEGTASPELSPRAQHPPGDPPDGDSSEAPGVDPEALAAESRWFVRLPSLLLGGSWAST